jgi:hypothetical protein
MVGKSQMLQVQSHNINGRKNRTEKSFFRNHETKPTLILAGFALIASWASL